MTLESALREWETQCWNQYNPDDEEYYYTKNEFRNEGELDNDSDTIQ